MSSKFEVIFVSNDRDESSFQQYFRQMPWHAIPYYGETRDLLSEMYRVRGIPYLVILGPDGRKISDKGREVIMEGKLERLIAS
ncbi:hypothetical protein FSP39_013145 [Pinctada imbricata]|uniref:protein-disulfide reductase n=1 Tax=Pinctada imbricata TaxID=66713 RepID=A0AA89BX15_PINIB|nr:hypothetical protein FSP39_013145 [Pinctada imbricata]